MGHGAFMINSASLKFNHSEKGDDGASTLFCFGSGDLIVLTFKPKDKKIFFSVKDNVEMQA